MATGSFSAAFFTTLAAGFFATAFFAGALVLDTTLGAVVFLGVAFGVAFFVGAAVVFLAVFVAADDALAFAFHPKRFNLPTTAFFDNPNRLPISDVDNPLPTKAFNFFNVALSQPLLILQNPCYNLLCNKCITVSIRKAREKNMIFYLFLALLFTGAIGCAIAISVADFRRRIIPDAYLLPLFMIGLVVVNFMPGWICTPRTSAIGGMIGYVMGAGVGFVFDIIRRRHDPHAESPIGMGDIKLLATGGVWLGPNGLAIAMVASCIFGCIWARLKHQQFIPFAPFFVAGAILALIASVFLL